MSHDYSVVMEAISVGTTFKGDRSHTEMVAVLTIDIDLNTIAVLDISDLRNPDHFTSTVLNHCHDEMLDMYPAHANETTVHMNGRPEHLDAMIHSAKNAYIQTTANNGDSVGNLDEFVKDWLSDDEIGDIGRASSVDDMDSVVLDRYWPLLCTFDHEQVRHQAYAVIRNHDRAAEMGIKDCLQYVLWQQAVEVVRGRI